MKLQHAFPIVVALVALALPAVAQDAPPASPAPQPESPACLSLAPALPGVEIFPIVPTIGGGRTCGAFLPDGSPNPDWPECNSGGGGIPGPSCDGISICYCLCRYNHRCDLDPSECTPLGNCLNDCDAQYPGCPYPGGGYPSTLAECF